MGACILAPGSARPMAATDGRWGVGALGPARPGPILDAWTGGINLLTSQLLAILPPRCP